MTLTTDSGYFHSSAPARRSGSLEGRQVRLGAVFAIAGFVLSMALLGPATSASAGHRDGSDADHGE